MPSFSATRPQPDLSVRHAGSDGAALTLTHYAPRGQQARHEHDHAQISFLVAGSAQETIGQACHEVTVPAVCIKPSGADHENHWGTNGALIVSARLRNWDRESAPRFPIASWIPCATKSVAPIVAAALLTQGTDEIDSAIDDLIALLGAGPVTTRRSPGWLSTVTEALWDSESLTAEEAARLAGVHRVHLSRCFAQHYGVPFSVYRKRVMLGRAIDATVRSEEPLADVAHAAGFADQSHMHRTLGSVMGVTPRQLRTAFLARATAC